MHLRVQPSQGLDDHHPTDYGTTLSVLILGSGRCRSLHIDIDLLSQHFSQGTVGSVAKEAIAGGSSFRPSHRLSQNNESLKIGQRLSTHNCFRLLTVSNGQGRAISAKGNSR